MCMHDIRITRTIYLNVPSVKVISSNYGIVFTLLCIDLMFV